MTARRSSAFFNSDVSSLADEMAYRLSDDYGLTDESQNVLRILIEGAVYGVWCDLERAEQVEA
jgi:hypothetical protein